MNLKQMYNYMSSNVEQFKWQEQVKKTIAEPGDRALVLVCCSVLDLQLERILKEFMLEDKKRDEELFKNQMPLSSFSSKISMCYYLGLISEYEKTMINYMRKIRNKFAHEVGISCLEDSNAIISWCKELYIPEKTFIPDVIKIDKDGEFEEFDTNPFPDESLRTRFITVFSSLSLWLFEREVMVASVQKREKYLDINAVDKLKNGYQLHNLQEQQYNYLIDKLHSTLAECKLEMKKFEEMEEKGIGDLKKIRISKRELMEIMHQCEMDIKNTEERKKEEQLQIGMAEEDYKYLYEKIIDVVERSYAKKTINSCKV